MEIALKQDKATKGTVRVAGELAETGQPLRFYIPRYLLHVAGLPAKGLRGTLRAEKGRVTLTVQAG